MQGSLSVRIVVSCGELYAAPRTIDAGMVLQAVRQYMPNLSARGQPMESKLARNIVEDVTAEMGMNFNGELVREVTRECVLEEGKGEDRCRLPTLLIQVMLDMARLTLNARLADTMQKGLHATATRSYFESSENPPALTICVAVVGPAGCGKSALISAFTGNGEAEGSSKSGCIKVVKRHLPTDLIVQFDVLEVGTAEELKGLSDYRLHVALILAELSHCEVCIHLTILILEHTIARRSTPKRGKSNS